MNAVAPSPLVLDGLVVGAMLFALGLVGILARRNMIVMFLCAELMLQGISVTLVAWSRHHGDWGGHVLVILVLTVAAWQSLREANLPRTVDRELPAIDTVPPRFPKLTPAGVEPAADEDALLEREQV